MNTYDPQFFKYVILTTSISLYAGSDTREVASNMSRAGHPQPAAAYTVAAMDSDLKEGGRRPRPHNRAPFSSSRESLNTMMPPQKKYSFCSHI
jgi:hypothetical protein